MEAFTPEQVQWKSFLGGVGARIQYRWSIQESVFEAFENYRLTAGVWGGFWSLIITNCEKVARVSKACTSICMWARAMHLYYIVCKEVAPKRALLAEAQGQLDEVMIELNCARAKLKDVLLVEHRISNIYRKIHSQQKNLVQPICFFCYFLGSKFTPSKKISYIPSVFFVIFWGVNSRSQF
jgi:hypothetical protein